MQPDLADQIRQKHQETGWGRKRLADFFGCSKWTVRVVLAHHSSNPTPPPIPDEQPIVVGATPHEPSVRDIEDAWQKAMAVQVKTRTAIARRETQTITIDPARPIAIAYLSDMHFGSAGTDYITSKYDAELVRDTPGMYAIYHGDGTDNWLVGKLQGLQRGQAVSYDDEWLLFEGWLRTISHKLLVVVEGNHGLWSYKLAGVDRVKELLQGKNILYDQHQVVFDFILGNYRWRHMIRHKWRFNSVFNPTHGLEVGWDRGDVDYDIAVGGHTHIGTYCRPFHKHNKRRYAILTGTYKQVDKFGDEIGFPSPKDRGCGAMVYLPDGRLFWTEDLQTAADLLTFYRSRY